jgi:hypothetical protein
VTDHVAVWESVHTAIHALLSDAQQKQQVEQAAIYGVLCAFVALVVTAYQGAAKDERPG